MNDFFENKDYWENRYKTLGGKRTVGKSGWTKEAYDKCRIIWTDWFIPALSFLQLEGINNTLDFGCGHGRWYNLLNSISNKYYGTDLIKQETDADAHFEVIKDNTIPFDSLKFDLIFTCVTLQHVIDDLLLKHYITQFYYRLNPGKFIFIVENVANAKDNTYIKFRSIETYRNLFEVAGFTLLYYDSMNMGGEPHALQIFQKK
jgi:SAM-dependent methyltransferase